MDITGVVGIQCSHVFIKAMVDLQLGEKYEIFHFEAVTYSSIWEDLRIQTMASRMLFDSNDSSLRMRTPMLSSSPAVTMFYPMTSLAHIM